MRLATADTFSSETASPPSIQALYMPMMAPTSEDMQMPTVSGSASMRARPRPPYLFGHGTREPVRQNARRHRREDVLPHGNIRLHRLAHLREKNLQVGFYPGAVFAILRHAAAHVAFHRIEDFADYGVDAVVEHGVDRSVMQIERLAVDVGLARKFGYRDLVVVFRPNEPIEGCKQRLARLQHAPIELSRFRCQAIVAHKRLRLPLSLRDPAHGMRLSLGSIAKYNPHL